jgi:hypothetical protein
MGFTEWHAVVLAAVLVVLVAVVVVMVVAVVVALYAQSVTSTSTPLSAMGREEGVERNSSVMETVNVREGGDEEEEEEEDDVFVEGIERRR